MSPAATVTTLRTAADAGALPAPPCPTWNGAGVRWEPWQPIPPITHVDPTCEACGYLGPLSTAFGLIEGLSRASHTVPDTGTLHLSAHGCPRCQSVIVFELEPGGQSAPAILCDSCDALCGVGANLEEARAALVALGGWTAGDGADWDLCRSCNPERAGDPGGASPATPEPTRRAVEQANRDGKARAIALYCWRMGLTPDDYARVLLLPYSSRKRADLTLTKFARAAYATSPREGDRQRQPPSSRRSPTWRLVAEKLDAMRALEAAGDERVPARDLLHERERWGLGPALADANAPDQAEGASDREDAAGRTGGTGADQCGESRSCAEAGLSHGYTGTGPSPEDASPTPSLPAGVIACGPGPLTADDVAAVVEFAEQLRELGPAPAVADERGGDLPRGWRELAALPPLDYGSCIHHPTRRPIVITPDGGRCAWCPPAQAEIPVRWNPTHEQLAALFGKKVPKEISVPFSSVRDGWGMRLDWTPRHCNAPVRCYCGRCPQPLTTDPTPTPRTTP